MPFRLSPARVPPMQNSATGAEVDASSPTARPIGAGSATPLAAHAAAHLARGQPGALQPDPVQRDPHRKQGDQRRQRMMNQRPSEQVEILLRGSGTEARSAAGSGNDCVMAWHGLILLNIAKSRGKP